MQHHTVTDYKQLTIDSIRQKFPSFFIGIALVIFAFFTGFEIFMNQYLFVVKKNTKPPGNILSKTSKIKTYTVVEGDDLWKISEKVYGSGFNGYDIAEFNNIPDPFILSAGQILKIPEVKPKLPTTGETSSTSTTQVTVTGNKYIVQLGEDLGIIAQKTYGDPLMWQKIAIANNLSDPNTIHQGQILIIPR